MEIFRSQDKQLDRQLDGWIKHPARELEATFGAGGQVDPTQFLAVVHRLKSKEYEALPPVDYMTIMVKDTTSSINVRRDTIKNNTRFTISGVGSIEEYCRTETLPDPSNYDVIVKSRIGDPNEDDLALEEYDTKIKVRREQEQDSKENIVEEMKNKWSELDKAFRLIRRWTFKGKGFVFDLSMIRSNKRNASGAYIFTKTFNDPQNDILNEPPTYEIEVELKHAPETDTVQKAKTVLIKAIGEVLRGLQRNSVLIGNTQRKRAFDAYMILINAKEPIFRGVKPRTLEMKNFVAKGNPKVPNIRQGYNVTDKADGLRVLGFCDDKGELFLIDKALNVYRTALQNEACRNSLVDGEWITSIKDKTKPGFQKATQQLWLFDIYIAPNKKVVDTLPFWTKEASAPSRHNELLAWHTAWMKDGPSLTVKNVAASSRMIVKLKEFEFAEKGDKQIFQKASSVLRRETEYNTDGLIFTPNQAPLPDADTNFKEQFKWKPAEENTIDFLVRVEKDPEIKTGLYDGAEVLYKTLTLKVGSTMNPACANPRETILYEKEIPRGGCRGDRFYKTKKGKYKAVPFNPTDYADPNASVCKVAVKVNPITGEKIIVTEKTEELIEDKSIVEMRYDMSKPDGWRWIPVRVRLDKTEKLQRGELGGTLNADFTADSVWNSIHNPITRGMISTGKEAPLQGELQVTDTEKAVDMTKYFERRATREQLMSVEGMRNFHKHYIKGQMLLKPALKGGSKTLLDLAVGEAADINRWVANNVGFVYGMDIAASGILDSHRGAYIKYMNRLSENLAIPEAEREAIAPMIFGIGDVSKNLESGEAGMNEEESNILRSVFGKFAPSKAVPPFVEKEGKDKLKAGADVISCMFALHYFFKDEKTFQGLLKNINQNLAMNGYFVACFFDGQKVFDLLSSKKRGESVVGADRNLVLWKITKQYKNTVLPSDNTGFGLEIKNKFITIGTEHSEYLVPFELLENKMEEIGCVLITDPNELKALGLPASTETFDKSYERVREEAKKDDKDIYPMIKPVRDYSFLNRWCIFKRVSTTALNEEQKATLTAPKPVTVEVKEKEVSVKPPTSLAWQETLNAGKPTTAVAEVRVAKEATNALKPEAPSGVIANLTVKRVVDEKPIKEGLGTVLAGVTVPIQAPAKEMEPSEVFQFGPLEGDTEEIKEEGTGKVLYPNASRYIAPYYPFTITEDGVDYPSILHFMKAMEYKKATDKPNLGKNFFGTEGSIHQAALRKYLGQNKKLDEILLEEVKDIQKKIPALDKSVKYDAAKWTSDVEDRYWKQAYEVRREKDPVFVEILEQLRELKKYLLYKPTKTKTSDLGGILKLVRRNKKKLVEVDGENKLGNLLMRLAGYPGYGKIEPAGKQEEDE